MGAVNDEKRNTDRRSGTMHRAPVGRGERPRRSAVTVAFLVALSLAAVPATASALPSPAVHQVDPLAQWVAQNMPTAVTLASTAALVTADGNSLDIEALKTDCPALATASDQMAAALPTPDPQLTETLTNAITHFKASAEACMAGIDPFEPGTVQSAVDDMHAAFADVKSAIEVLDAQLAATPPPAAIAVSPAFTG